MSSTTIDIYSILSTKPHNSHYLRRYYNFIEACRKANEGLTGYFEKHHICPKAKDMFPEFENFNDNPWNLVRLTARQHYLAHWMLWRSFGIGSQTRAFLLMNGNTSHKINGYTKKIGSKTHEILKLQKNFLQIEVMKKNHKDNRIDQTTLSSNMSERNKDSEFRRKQAEGSSKRLKNSSWYNNGIKNIRSKTDPGPEWKLGRIPYNNKKVCCLYCGLEGVGHNMKRYHFDNCKRKLL